MTMGNIGLLLGEEALDDAAEQAGVGSVDGRLAPK